MYMKVAYRCPKCSCVSEYTNETRAERIFCPNCGGCLPDADSQRVLNILRSAAGLSDEYGETSLPTLEFIPSAWESLRRNQPPTPCIPDSL